MSHPIKPPYSLHALGDRFEIVPGDDLPPLRLFLYGADKAMTVQPASFETVHYSLGTSVDTTPVAICGRQATSA